MTAALLALVAAGAPAAADTLSQGESRTFRSGAELLADCRSSEAQAQGRCFGYLMAIADVLGGVGARVDGLNACFRGDETPQRLLEVVTRFLEANPHSNSIRADGLVAYALSLELPCN